MFEVTSGSRNHRSIATAAARIKHVLAFKCLGLLLGLSAIHLYGQQPLSFVVDGKTYTADIAWVVRQAGVDYKGKTTHTFDRTKEAAFDLAVSFRFVQDSVPADNAIVWGFQFQQEGDLIAPFTGEKRARSARQFQRFVVSGNGEARLVIVPKAWRKVFAGRYQILGQGTPVTLSFSLTEGSQAPLAAPQSAAPKNGQALAADTEKPADSARVAPKPAEPEKAVAEEAVVYAQALEVTDTIQRIRALMDFVDKYASQGNKSPLVKKAIRNVPLTASVPERKKDGSYSYTLQYAVKPVVDSTQAKAWKWNLSESAFGKYQLTLVALKDTVAPFTITDIGKNAPFNRPRTLHPLERISIRLVEETADSFRIATNGGQPPFIVFLSLNGFPRGRYVINATNGIWSFAKSDCTECITGNYNLEVYNSDFSTLLLQTDPVIRIQRRSYWTWLAAGLGLALAVWFLIGPAPRMWSRFQYMRRLRDIEAWERREAAEAEKRKKI